MELDKPSPAAPKTPPSDDDKADDEDEEVENERKTKVETSPEPPNS